MDLQEVLAEESGGALYDLHGRVICTGDLNIGIMQNNI